MFNNFEKHFNLNMDYYIEESTDPLTIFQSKYQGMSLGDGMYRVFMKDDSVKWIDIIKEGYPEFEGDFQPFAYDWLGRCFAMDLRPGSRGKIVMFEIRTGEVLEIPSDMIEFHEKQIPLSHHDCLASEFLGEWREANSEALRPNQCIGYKTPLFLGGADTIYNLEISDIEMYWYTCSMMKNQ